MQFKYNINHYISLMPSHIYPHHVVEKVREYGISPSEYMGDKNIEKGDSNVIPEERLIIYAKILNVRVEDLKN